MIENQHQVNVANSNIKKFEVKLSPLLDDLDGNKLSADERKINKMTVFTFKNEITQLKNKISEFKDLKLTIHNLMIKEKSKLLGDKAQIEMLDYRGGVIYALKANEIDAVLNAVKAYFSSDTI